MNVPVPEELVAEVERFMMDLDMRLIAARSDTVDIQAVANVVPTFNERCRTALSVLADASLPGQHLSIGELATSLEWSAYETEGVVQELIELVWANFGPKLRIAPSAITDPTAGAINWDERQVVMWRDLAQAVVEEAQRAEGA